MERIAMSREERDELDWLKRAKDGSITPREAAKRIGVSDRWVWELLQRMDQQGDSVVSAWAERTSLQSQAFSKSKATSTGHPEAAGLA